MKSKKKSGLNLKRKDGDTENAAVTLVFLIAIALIGWYTYSAVNNLNKPKPYNASTPTAEQSWAQEMKAEIEVAKRLIEVHDYKGALEHFREARRLARKLSTHTEAFETQLNDCINQCARAAGE